jgi:hypothetical protein
MIYKEGKLENGKLVFTNEIEVDQSQLTSGCWLIQIKGREACRTCVLYHTQDCGGKNILSNIEAESFKNYWKKNK